MERELKLTYKDFNSRFFSGVLPDMPVKFGEVDGKGIFQCDTHRSKMPFGIFMRPGTGSITLHEECRHDDWPGVLLHEMVHAYFASVGMGHHLHGEMFKKKCKRIEEASGIAIPR